MVGTRLHVTVNLGRYVVGGWGKTKRESLSVGVQGFVPNKLLRLVNFINASILPRGDHF